MVGASHGTVFAIVTVHELSFHIGKGYRTEHATQATHPSQIGQNSVKYPFIEKGLLRKLAKVS